MAVHSYHTPVLLKESVDFLVTNPQGVYIDGTLGGGGHTEAIARKVREGKIIAFDRDADAIEFAKERLKEFDNITFVQENIRNVKEVCEDLGEEKLDGILLDLGISSHQIDTVSVGMSYRIDAPLDMRVDRVGEVTAERIINEWSEHDLAKLFYELGEESRSRKIAHGIVKRRFEKPIETTHALREIVEREVRELDRSATLARIFQALRIEVNDELGSLRDALEGAYELLNVGGRVVVISYHSLEDRIVKEWMRKKSHAPRKNPVTGRDEWDENMKLEVLTKKIITPSEEEIAHNARARSAKMRVAQKVLIY